MHPHYGRGGKRSAEPRVQAVALSRRYSILARPPYEGDVAFTGNAEGRKMRADRLGDIGWRQMRVVLFGHTGIGMA